MNSIKIQPLAWLKNLFARTYIANVCNHPTKREGKTESFGECYAIVMPLAGNGRPDYCLECIGKMAIKCGWCGQLIHIGDFVTPYLPRPNMPDYTRYHQDGPGLARTVIGCCRASCREFPGDEHGQWLPPGKIQRSPSVIEQLAVAVESGDECCVAFTKT